MSRTYYLYLASIITSPTVLKRKSTNKRTMEKQQEEMQQEQQQQTLISTTASLDLSDYQRGQLTHLRSLVLLSPPPPPEPPAPLADAPNKEKDEEKEDLEYRKAAKILRKHMKHMRDEASKMQASAPSPANALHIAAPSQHHPAAGSSPLMVPVLSPGRTSPPNKRKMYRALPMNRESSKNPSKKKAKQPASSGGGGAGKIASSSNSTKPPRSQALEPGRRNSNDETPAQLRQARQAFEQARIVYNTKQRHFNVLSFQLAELTNSEPGAAFREEDLTASPSDDNNISLLRRQIATFRPYLVEAKNKMDELERKTHAISLKTMTAKRTKAPIRKKQKAVDEPTGNRRKKQKASEPNEKKSRAKKESKPTESEKASEPTSIKKESEPTSSNML